MVDQLDSFCVYDESSLETRVEVVGISNFGTLSRQGHGYLNILCRCIIRRSATDQREHVTHGFLLDQQTRLDYGSFTFSH